MKKSLFVLFSFLATMNAWSLNYCQSSAFGYGKSATGGGNATPTVITSLGSISSSNKVYVITQNITVSKMVKISKLSNITIIGMPGVKLISNKQDKDNSGILYFSGCKNVIIRNLTFEGPGAYDCDGNDLLCFDGVTNAWVDHCDFQDGCDGNFDNKGTTDNVTVSWCRFRYLKAPKAGGTGGSDDHRYTNLLGSGSSDKPSDGTYNMTWAYCWWDSGCKERMVRCRNASLHFLNCYWNSSVANYYIGPENVDCYLEGCYIEGKPSKANIFKSYGGKNGLTCKDCYSKNGLPTASGRTVVIPTYSYETVSYTEAKTMVTNATCGAGATLTVTTAGAVSSSCDSGTPQPEAAPTLNDPSNKSQSVSTGSAIAAITFTASGTATAISVSNLPAGLSSAPNGLSLTISGTPTAGGTYTVTATNASGATTTKQGTITVSGTPGPGPTPPTPAGEHSFTWNISNPNFAALAGDIAATTTVDGLTIVATSSSKVTIDEQEIKYGFAEGDTVVFVNRLKTGGSGKADCRHIKFAVTGNCTIEVWAKSSSSSEDRTINIYTNSLDSKNLIGTLPAPKGDLTKQSFTYTGGPTTIVMGSASSGINFYAINIVYPSPTDLQRAKESLMPNKIIRNGQLFIRHNGHYYNCVGQPVFR
ncbi:MAG: hypothetical protein MJZ75_00210 [Paludibacteraceae bacterium]|nr:hypothetical protein [Paludibacteraceae bacterium]